MQLCRALRKEYGFNAIRLMPTNLYGPGDNYHPTHSHVMSAMIRGSHGAKGAKAPGITCWGTGSPLREFLYADNLAFAALFSLEHWQPDADDPIQHLNVGTGVDLSIKELADLVASTLGCEGEIHWDANKPGGTPQEAIGCELAGGQAFR
jgi:GDP-L-fucose synthase